MNVPSSELDAIGSLRKSLDQLASVLKGNTGSSVIRGGFDTVYLRLKELEAEVLRSHLHVLVAQRSSIEGMNSIVDRLQPVVDLLKEQSTDFLG